MKNLIPYLGALGAAVFTVAWVMNTNEASPELASTEPASSVKLPIEKTIQGKSTSPKHLTTGVHAGPALAVPMEPIHNTLKLGKKIISGSCPYGDAGFKALAEQGVKTVISVDGARPDEKIAKKYGMRYVHIPVTYSGINRQQSLAIARAVRDLPGPVFIHCHHGKHRGPTAAVIAAMVNEGWTSEQAQAAMKQAGTSKHYTGLWAAAREWKAPTKEELDKADNSFPVAAKVPATAAAMVSIDERWEHLGQVREAKWKAPAAHPDIDPPHEALLLREDFRELARSPESIKRPADYLKKLKAAEEASAALETALRAKDSTQAQEAFTQIEQSCKSCHVVYRDVNPSNSVHKAQ